MPTWNTPPTFTAGRVVSPTDIATYFFGNDAYLLNRPGQRIIRNNAADYTTTSATFVDIDTTNLSITLAMSGSAALVTFTASAPLVAAALTRGIDITVDGVRYSGATNGIWVQTQTASVIPFDSPITFSVLITGLSAASHTFRPQWLTSANTFTLRSTAAAMVMFSAQEVA